MTRFRKVKYAALVPALAIPLAACNPQTPVNITVVGRIPANLLECTQTVPKPKGNYDAKAVSRFIVRLNGAWLSCRNDVNEIKRLQKEFLKSGGKYKIN